MREQCVSGVEHHGAVAVFAWHPLEHHPTAGFEARVFAFRLAGHERRVAISGASDLAARYKNLAVSIGFWN